MIACEICGNYFHADEIEKCPECGLELCPSCYERHVTKCTLQLDNDDLDEDKTRIPHICPDCGSNLQLDVDVDGSARVYCDECGFSQELDEAQIAELDAGELDEEENYLGDDAFTCPDCGRKFASDDYENGDAGNGFCRECAPNH